MEEKNYKRKNRSVSPETAKKISDSLKSYNTAHPRGTASTGSEWAKSIHILDLHENQSPETFLSMRLYLSLLPASGLLLATLILVIYPLNRAKVKTIQAELEAKGLREPESANP